MIPVCLFHPDNDAHTHTRTLRYPNPPIWSHIAAPLSPYTNRSHNLFLVSGGANCYVLEKVETEESKDEEAAPQNHDHDAGHAPEGKPKPHYHEYFTYNYHIYLSKIQ